MGKLIFVNRFFYPDQSATSQLLSDLAFEFAHRGRTVCVIASRTGYDARTAALPAAEQIRGVQVYRTASTRFGRSRPWGRLADYLTFYVSSVWRLLRTTRRGDVVIGMTDPPMLNVATQVIARLKGARSVSWFQDVFPDVARAAGTGTRFHLAVELASAVLGRVAAGANRHVDAAVVLGQGMQRRMLVFGGRPERTRLISNWSDLERVRPVAHQDNPLRHEWAPGGEFLVGYSGNMGIAHDLRPLLDAAERLRDQPAIRFLLIGEGKQRASLEAVARSKGLTNVSFLPYQAREQLHFSLSAIDLHVVSLRPSMEGLIVPSKFFGVAAAGRPTLFLGSATGEIAMLIRANDCGVTVEDANVDVDRLTDQILALANDPARCRAMGAAARHAAERDFSLNRTVELWNGLLADLQAGAWQPPALHRPIEQAQAPERH